MKTNIHTDATVKVVFEMEMTPDEYRSIQVSTQDGADQTAYNSMCEMARDAIRRGN